MKMPGLTDMLEGLIEAKIKADEDFAKRIRRLIDYTYGDVQEGEYEEIEDACGHENGHAV